MGAHLYRVTTEALLGWSAFGIAVALRWAGTDEAPRNAGCMHSIPRLDLTDRSLLLR